MASGTFSVEQFKRLKRLVRDISGIELKLKKKKMVQNRLDRRLKSVGLADYDEYIVLLENPVAAADEARHFFDVISTGETYFFRAPEHLEALKNHVFPGFFEDGTVNTVKCWSAGCAAGQEPYSIAMSFLEYQRRNPEAQINLLATDISADAVRSLRAGVYTNRETRGLDDYHADAYFVRLENGFEASDRLKDTVRSRVLNLKTDRFPARQHIIFCRNVMIYFSSEFRAELLEKFHESLAPGGYLFTGASESYREISKYFRTVKIGNAAVCRKQG